MAYQFRKRESLAMGVKRIACERVDKAIAALQRDDDGMAAVHDARKRFKEIRALLRLARGALGPVYERENLWYREVGHALASVRDLQVAPATWEMLLAGFPDLESTTGGALSRGRIEARLEALAGPVMQEGLQVQARILAVLPAARERIESWPLDSATFEASADGLRRTYRQGRRALHNIRGSDDDALWHEWRKRVQDLWHHSKLLRPVWPERMSPRVRRLKQIADLLGDDHDLVVFRGFLVREKDLFDWPAFRVRVERRIVERQWQLRAPAYRLGRQLWSEKPGRYTRRLQARWDSWRQA